MKYCIFILSFFLSFQEMFPASIQIVSSESYISIPTTADEIKAYCVFKNISNSIINVKMRYEPISITNGQEVAFCWGPICYPPKDEPFEPSDLITLQPEQSTNPNDFYVSFYPNGLEGKTIVKLILWVDGNPEDSVHWVVTFDAQIGNVNYSVIEPKIVSYIFKDNIPLKIFSQLVENSYNYSIFDSNGKLLINYKLEKDNIELSHLAKGAYTLVLHSEAKAYYIRFIKE
ncbi:MAG: T9SS type A sorting domain-containing protein [Candidatus Kapaibacteriales bacterium]